MAQYLLIESRDALESHDAGYFFELAAGLAKSGHLVTLFLVQNGVLPLRAGARPGLGSLVEARVEILADEFSLRERGIPVGQLAHGVRAAPIDVVVDRLAAGCKALWH